VSEKQNDMKKLIEKMRTNTDKQNRKTGALPRRRARIKMQKGKPMDGSNKQKQDVPMALPTILPEPKPVNPVPGSP
jgi:hypothetical protein